MSQAQRATFKVVVIGSARRLTKATDEGHLNEPGSSVDRWM